MAKPYIVVSHNRAIVAAACCCWRAPVGGTGGVPLYTPYLWVWGYLYIPTIYTYGGTYIYIGGVGGVGRGYLYIPTIYMYVHMLIYLLYICMCICLYT